MDLIGITQHNGFMAMFLTAIWSRCRRKAASL